MVFIHKMADGLTLRAHDDKWILAQDKREVCEEALIPFFVL